MTIRQSQSRLLLVVAALLWLWAAVACSSAKHVPAGQYLLDKVTIDVEPNDEGVNAAQLVNYLRQVPNHKVLGFAKLQLATYNLSGADSSKWFNRWVRRMGQPPVILNDELTDASAAQLRQSLVNRGFLDARVTNDTLLDGRSRKARVTYHVKPGHPHRVTSVDYLFEDTTLRRTLLPDSARMPVRVGALLDRNELDAERSLITERMRNHGYYGFGKEHVAFIVDTIAGDKSAGLTVVVKRPLRRRTEGYDTLPAHTLNIVRNVYYVTDFRPSSPGDVVVADTVECSPGVFMVYGPDRYLTPGVLIEKSFLAPGEMYDESDVTRTYQSLSRLGILKSINIDMRPSGTAMIDGRQCQLLDAVVLLSRNKLQSAAVEVEGTNSEGDLGFGVGISYQHRNVSKASNTFNAKIRVNYESLSGNLGGLINDRYTEYATEAGLTFPKFVFPFLSRDFRRKVKASSELALSFNYQERPEYTRVIAGAGWKYKWSSPDNRERRTFDLIDVNYVYLPQSTINFIDDIAPNNPLLRYSYEDHFIMRMGYTYYRTNRRPASSDISLRRPQRNIYSLRASAETAGNILYAISSLDGQHRHDGVFDVFGIAFSQYAKAEVDYAMTRVLGSRHSLAFHAGAGIGVPYGNSRVLPFEKRFYAGGANGVRGWGVRTLGPGAFDARNSVTSFINQCGDIRLDLNFEYRAKLFWVLEGVLFVDAGNIWTIHNYESQPGGMFHFDTFWKQIALAYGTGLRLDFTYFLVRLDLGMKAHNPARGQEPWPLLHPSWHRDATFHFAVGYPF